MPGRIPDDRTVPLVNSSPPIAIVLAISLGLLGACGDDDTSHAAAEAATTEATGTGGTADDPVVDEIQGILDAALVPGAIAWNFDSPPTAVSVAVRRPGRDDIVLASGKSIDGSPFDAEAPFNVGGLTESFVQTIAYQLIDEGLLDPTATVDQWLPAQPNADRVTVQMLLDGTHGWAPLPDASFGQITADANRKWTLAEVLATLATNPPLAEPGTFSNEGAEAAATALAYIAEQVTGSTLAELVEGRMAQPAGLDDTAIGDGTDPPGLEGGVFVLNGQRALTSDFPHTSYITYLAAEASAHSTLRDLLDLLDVWQSGDLFTTDRVPGPDRFLVERTLDVDSAPTGASFGYGIPFNGLCPCQTHGNSVTVTAIGRAPSSLGTDNHILYYTADDVSVVLHFDSSEWVDRAPLRQVADAIHDAATHR